MTSNGQPTPSVRSSRNLYIVAERDRENTLPDERAHAMFDETRRPPVPEAPGKPVDEPDGAIGRSQKQAARVRGHRAAPRPAQTDRNPRYTPSASGAPPSPRKSFKQNNFR